MNLQAPLKITLIDHAFFTKVAEDRGFRQMLILDQETALSHIAITPQAERWLILILELLDSITATLVDHWAQVEMLKRKMVDTKTRRVLLFAPQEAAPLYKLSPEAERELHHLAEMANIVAEVLVGVEI